jgi:hypothetical protein
MNDTEPRVGTTRTQHVAMIRRAGIGAVLRLLEKGYPRAAEERLFQSVEQQARLSGVSVTLPRPPAP